MDQKTVRLHYTEQGAGTALILVHGFPLDHTIWDAVVDQIPDTIRVICPDLRGYGQSPATEGIYSMALFASDLAALMDRSGIEKAVLAGHSMGGYISLAFAKNYSDRLAGLALVTSQAAADLPERKQGRYQLADLVEQQGAGAVVEASLMKYSPNARILEVTRSLMLRTDPKTISASLRGMAEREDMREYLAEIDVPALVIAGEVDELIAARGSEEMARMLPQGQLVIVPGGGHMAMLEAPDIVADALATLMLRL